MDFQTLEFPYYRYVQEYNKELILDNLSQFRPKIIFDLPDKLKKSKHVKKFRGKYFIICENYLKNIPINSLTDYFTEEQRIKCHYKNKQSPLQVWKKDKNEIIKKCNQKFGKVTVFNLREIIDTYVKTCNNFRITVCFAVIKYFKPKKWLDISAGWGDRLLSAILSKHIEYYESSDPNIDLHPGYDSMKETFCKSKKDNYIIHPTGFLEADLGDRMFDFIFSSPPFFDIEIYSDHSNDSITNFNTNELWINNFLVPCIQKCYDHLLNNGLLILYIHQEEALDRALKQFNSIMKYQGAIYFYESKPRQMHVWKKA